VPKSPSLCGGLMMGALSLSGGRRHISRLLTPPLPPSRLGICLSCAVLRVSPPPSSSLCGGAHVHTAANVARLRRGHVASPRLPHISGRVKAKRRGTASSFQPPYPHPTGGVSDARRGCLSQHRQKPQSPKRRRPQRRPHPRVFAGQKPPVPL